jgi:tRNA A37 threonylcarbamoyladenosine dehydratase
MGFDDRNKIIWGDDGAAALAASKVCVYGLGGVGAAAATDLVRSGVGSLIVVDFDTVQESNLNRVAYGISDYVGLPKIEAFSRYARSINPGINIDGYSEFVSGLEPGQYIPNGCDVYIDAIDTLNPKVNLIIELLERNFVFFSSMGTAGRIAPERLKIGSIWECHACPLARKVRQRLKHRGIKADITVVWSDETPVKPLSSPPEKNSAEIFNPSGRVRALQGSAPFVPQAAGHFLASLAVRSILCGVHRLAMATSIV